MQLQSSSIKCCKLAHMLTNVQPQHVRDRLASLWPDHNAQSISSPNTRTVAGVLVHFQEASVTCSPNTAALLLLLLGPSPFCCSHEGYGCSDCRSRCLMKICFIQLLGEVGSVLWCRGRCAVSSPMHRCTPSPATWYCPLQLSMRSRRCPCLRPPFCCEAPACATPNMCWRLSSLPDMNPRSAANLTLLPNYALLGCSRGCVIVCNQPVILNATDAVRCIICRGFALTLTRASPSTNLLQIPWVELERHSQKLAVDFAT